MSLKETRQLGIEFERRVQTMIPETEIVSKLDTETIYSFLNQYQDKFVHDIYKALDQTPTPSKPSAYIEGIIQGLLEYKKYTVESEDNMFTIKMQDDFGLYVTSSAIVEDSYRMEQANERPSGKGELPITLVSKTKALEFITRPHDDMRIMRQPIAYFDGDNKNKYIKVYYDRYTDPKYFKLSYYKIPQYMSLFDNKPCELDMSAFDDLVTGAVDLYVQYVAGTEARKRQMQEQLKRNNKEDEQ